MDLGLAEDEFWTLTPRQFALLLDRHTETRKAAEDMERWRFGVVAAAVFTAQGVEKKGSADGWTPRDFFPEPRRAQTEETMLAAMDMWARLSNPDTEQH